MKYLVLFLMVSCADSVVSPVEIVEIDSKCNKNDGVKEVRVWKHMFKIECKDEAVFTLIRK